MDPFSQSVIASPSKNGRRCVAIWWKKAPLHSPDSLL